MIRSRVAERYAQSLIDLAREQGVIDAVETDMQMISSAVRDSRDLRNLLASPIIDTHRKEQLLAEIFLGKVSEIVARFIVLLARKGRANDLPGVILAFRDLLDRQRNIAEAEITTAVDLDDSMKMRIENELSRISGSEIRARYTIDRSLVGGFRARFQDRMIDASVQHQLERLRESLTFG